ncbi:MAG TPA: hypothetical protein VHS99_02065 [Chloroflexota bacterium]|nr:hypothetical protein [Chloroflexota bacterium]
MQGAAGAVQRHGAGPTRRALWQWTARLGLAGGAATAAGAAAGCGAPALGWIKRLGREPVEVDVLVGSPSLVGALEPAVAAVNGSDGVYRLRLHRLPAPPMAGPADRGPRGAPAAQGMPSPADATQAWPAAAAEPQDTTSPDSPILAGARAAQAAGAAAIIAVDGSSDLAVMAMDGLVQALQPPAADGPAREWAAGIAPGALEGLRLRGTLHGLPLGVTVELLEYDPRLFEAAGLARPERRKRDGWMWRDFLDAARRLTGAGAGGDATGQLGLLSPGSLSSWVWQAGGDVVSQDGRRSPLAEARAVEAFIFYEQVHRAGVTGRAGDRGGRGYTYTPQGLRLGDAGGPRVAMNVGRVMPAGRPQWWPLRVAELPRLRSSATSVRVASALAILAGTTPPEPAYGATITLASAAQRHLVTPARVPTPAELRERSTGGAGLWEESEVQAYVASLRYGRSLPLVPDDGIRAIMADIVSRLLAGGEHTPPRAAREGAMAIERLLNS